LDGSAGTREADLAVRFAAFSASSVALISLCGTERTCRAKSVNLSNSSHWFFAFGLLLLELALTPLETSA
jgi:hypothetical protein